MNVYRITDNKYIQDLSGRGAAMYGGRWNNKNTYIVYTAESRSLALLEVLVHRGKIAPAGYSMATIQIPDNSIQIFPRKKLPDGWAENPPPDYVKTIGDFFIRSNSSVALKMPSSIMPGDHNFLLNPAHTHFAEARIIAVEAITIDERLLHTTLPA